MEKEEQGNELSFPHIELDTYSGKPCNQHFGLTKRELFAAMAMQSRINAHCPKISMTDEEIKFISIDSIRCADALITELNKE